ncbi:hypothetical protein QJS10_CPB21g01023 [Acorus calamus]|uniref:DUF4283 domain-containing protein n=1 Tax=Acorus calamus TaxID=4465 RepID=A0AAV9C4C8_ACOCL|nr:hypothetical protein QJS10_CPB21g01023 [Acorus calamus]
MAEPEASRPPDTFVGDTTPVWTQAGGSAVHLTRRQARLRSMRPLKQVVLWRLILQLDHNPLSFSGGSLRSLTNYKTRPTTATQGHEQMTYIAPTLNGEQPLAIVEEEEYASSFSHWGNALVGYVIGTTSVFTPFLKFLRCLWKPKGEIRLMLKGNGLFVVTFENEEDMNAVLEGGPWTMASRPFVLQRWSPSSRMEQERLTSIPIWKPLQVHANTSHIHSKTNGQVTQVWTKVKNNKNKQCANPCPTTSTGKPVLENLSNPFASLQIEVESDPQPVCRSP